MKFDIVFEGGGAKGMAQIGAMEAFFTDGHSFGRLVGTSAGAMTAGLLAAGFSAAELKAAALQTLPNGKPIFSSFMDIATGFSKDQIEHSWLYSMLQSINWPLIPEWIEDGIDMSVMNLLLKSSHFRELFSFVELGGLYAGDALYSYLRSELNSKGGLGDATLTQFAAQTGRDLTVVASDTIGEQMLVLNHRTAPDLPTAWAIRMSMNIPFVWQGVIWQADWGKFNGQDMTGHSVVDGGLISNFALDLLVSDEKEVQRDMGQPTGNPVLGMLLDPNLPVPNAPPSTDKGIGKMGQDLLHSKVVGRIERDLDTMLSARDQFIMTGFQQDVCHLPVKGYDRV